MFPSVPASRPSLLSMHCSSCVPCVSFSSSPPTCHSPCLFGGTLCSEAPFWLHSGGGGVGSPALLPMSASLLLVLLFTRYQQFHQLSMSFRVTRLTDMTEWSMLGHHPLPPEGLHMSLPSVRLSDEPAGGSLASHPPPAHYSSFPILLPLDGPSTPAWHVAESRGFLTPEPTLPQKNGINKIKQIKIINETMIINEVAFWGVFGFSPHSVG